MNIAELLDPRSLIALFALFVAIWSIISSRKHNRLSVRPHLFESIENDSVNLKCGYYIINKGSGPAIIKSTIFHLDGRIVDPKDLLNIIEKLPAEFGIHINKLKPGRGISKDEVCNIIEIQWDSLKYNLPKDSEVKQRIANDVKSFSSQIASRLGVDIEWVSLYGEKGKLHSHPHKD